MKTLIILMFLMSILDLVVSPLVVLKIKKNGRFHYLLSTLYFLTFLIAVAFFGTAVIQSLNSFSIFSVLFKTTFTITLLFIIVNMFEINKYFFNKIDTKKIDIQDMSEEGKEMMNVLIENIEEENNKNVYQKISEMVNSFVNSLMNDIFLIYLILIRQNKKMDESVESVDYFENLNFLQSINMINNRLVIDGLVLMLSIFGFLVIV